MKKILRNSAERYGDACIKKGPRLPGTVVSEWDACHPCRGGTLTLGPSGQLHVKD
jgi:hypothetical protein